MNSLARSRVTIRACVEGKEIEESLTDEKVVEASRFDADGVKILSVED